MNERKYNPPLEKVTSSQRAKVRGAARPHAKGRVMIADERQVADVLARFAQGNRTFGQCCGDAGVSQIAVWRRIKDDRLTKSELAALIAFKAFNRADSASEDGNPTALSTFVRASEKMAASLDPVSFGDKVQVESRQLIINTNLDFGVVERFEAAIDEGRTLEDARRCAERSNPLSFDSVQREGEMDVCSSAGDAEILPAAPDFETVQRSTVQQVGEVVGERSIYRRR